MLIKQDLLLLGQTKCNFFLFTFDNVTQILTIVHTPLNFQKHLVVLVKSLCKGSSSLPKSDVVTFTALLKSAAQPTIFKNEMPSEYILIYIYNFM